MEVFRILMFTESLYVYMDGGGVIALHMHSL